jgi:hypothetical protein
MPAKSRKIDKNGSSHSTGIPITTLRAIYQSGSLAILTEEIKMSLHIGTKEADEIRSKLRLRFNVATNIHEVYTTYHRSGIWQWYPILDHVAEWYKTNFGLRVDSFVKPSIKTGGFMEIPNPSSPKDAQGKDSGSSPSSMNMDSKKE